MWPFKNLKEKLRRQDAVEKYRQWLKKWLLKGAKFHLIAAAVVLVVTVLLAKTYLLPPTQPVNDTTSPSNPPVAAQKSEPKQAAVPLSQQAQPTQPQPIDINQLVMPVSGPILIGYHQPYYSEEYQDYRFSSGLALQTSSAEAVRAALAGKVVAVDLDQQQGFTVVIDHGQNYQTTYQGLDSVQVAVNQQVDQGDVLGATPSGQEKNQINFILTQNGQPINPLP